VSQVRAFVALELPEPVRQALAALVARARLDAPGTLSWVAEEKLHLTLAFLGACAPERLEVLARHLETRLAEEPALPLSLATPGLFPGPARPAVLWVGVGGGERLALLQQRVERLCDGAGLPVEVRPFVAHLTCARVRRQGPAGALAAHWLPLPVDPTRWAQSSVSLLRSDPGPGGARDSAMATVALVP
jgi:2'-5' RNA ligase